MAEFVLAAAMPHGPTVQTHWSKFGQFEQRDPNNPQLATEPAVTFEQLVAHAAETKPWLPNRLTESAWEEVYERGQKGLETIRGVLKEAAPDVVVVIGDDQHEQLLDDNMPQFCLYYGDSVQAVEGGTRGDRRPGDPPADPASLSVREYPTASDLSMHLIKHLIGQSFDIATSNKLRSERGLGHAFTFLHRNNMLPREDLPTVPVMVNTFYPPNQPPVGRCYAFGQALRRAIEAWDSDMRVAVVGSGGMSHVIVDEELDQLTLEGIRTKSPELLGSLPEERLIRGTSEIKNWVVVAGAAETLEPTIVDYIPAYRSSAAMGHGLAFAYWR
jgi:3-O-methylgallate 3,4-dioxygenase